ncbi:MAG: AAA family ATPase [Proteobacteria bacterium]|nr:AAA family ATPase [Pseudomonadota bacterium]
MWGATWVPTLSLADEALDSDARVVALIDEQLALLAAAEDNPRAIVTGGAGTGKTMLARAQCTRAAARVPRVLYLCFTDALGVAVERGFAPARAAGAAVHAMPIRRFAGALLAASGAPLPTDPSFWETASLAAACDALPPVDARPDLVVVDEAQDLDQGDWDLVGELAGPRALWILGDERQAFWRRPAIPEALTLGAVRLKLGTQLRNPPAIAALAARYHDANSPLVADGAPDVVRIVEATLGSELDRLAAVVVELLREGARPADIAILSLAGQAASQLLRRDTLGSQRLRRADHADAAGHLIADTFLRFKGLERPFVILVELAAGHASQYDRRMHIAITRATSRLVVIATSQDVAADPRLARSETVDSDRP